MLQIGDLNDRITREGVQSLMLIQEALHEAKISSIAEEIRRRGNVKFVMIAGAFIFRKNKLFTQIMQSSFQHMG